MLDVLLVAVAIIFILIGLLGAVVPILPGPPFTYIGMLILHFTRFTHYSTDFLLFFLFLTVMVTLIDNILPVWMTKKFGGSKYAARGSLAGMIAGMIFFRRWGWFSVLFSEP
ncbi:MAG: DUF456 domain-containing protein [Rikenellaceae bacterium]|nr:DUF456 domain-containing protein [Rikenellaceae bacterium]